MCDQVREVVQARRCGHGERGEPEWLPFLDAFRNPSEDFRIEVLAVGGLLQGTELASLALN